MTGDLWYWDARRIEWRKSEPASFLRVPTRADLKLSKPPRPLPEPRYFRRELDKPRAVTGSEIMGLCWLAATVGFCFGYYLAS